MSPLCAAENIPGVNHMHLKNLRWLEVGKKRFKPEWGGGIPLIKDAFEDRVLEFLWKMRGHPFFLQKQIKISPFYPQATSPNHLSSYPFLRKPFYSLQTPCMPEETFSKTSFRNLGRIRVLPLQRKQ